MVVKNQMTENIFCLKNDYCWCFLGTPFIKQWECCFSLFLVLSVTSGIDLHAMPSQFFNNSEKPESHITGDLQITSVGRA